MKCLIACLNDVSADPRPLRHLEHLNKHKYKVDLLSYQNSNNNISFNNHFIISKNPSLIDKLKKQICKYFSYAPLYKTIRLKLFAYSLGIEIHKINDVEYDLIILEDIQFLPFFNNSNTLIDLREYYTRQREDSLLFNLLEKPLRKWIISNYFNSKVKAITVSRGLSNQYLKEFDIPSKIIRSIPNYNQLPYKRTDPMKISIVHHGIANRNRKLEDMIDIVKLLDKRFFMDFYLTGSEEYINFLIDYSKNIPRINFIKPVPHHLIIKTISKYDIGLFYNNPSTFNLMNCLPNKLFEFIQARLAVAIGPSPQMAEVVNKYQCGVIADDFDIYDIAQKLNNLNNKDIDYFKSKSNSASENLCWEKESQKLTNIINNLNSDFALT